MTVNTVILGLGALLLLVGILGGGFELKEFKVPKVGPAGRVVSTVAGVFFVVLGLGLESSDAASKKVEPEKPAYAQPMPSVQPPEQPSPVEFTVYDHLDGNQVTEQVTVLIDGKVKGQLTVDQHNQESMIAITVPSRGRYSYTVQSKTVVSQAGGLYEYEGTGQGMINVEDGKRFNLALTTSGTTWLVTLLEANASERAVQQQ
ncbi:MAG TPA: hypothetical protein VKH81_14420 [Candidatus Angelobacter sp.]|nr:hypothetical protein [Candidatus Angelobacter sp.]